RNHYEICHRDNFEILLRMARKARQPQFKALGIEYLPLFIASFQGLTKTGEDISALQDVLDQLFGYPAPAGAWEEFILPARLNPYYPAWLDSLMQSSELIWFGCGTKKTGFAFIEDLELFKKNDIKANDETDNESSEANKIYSVISESKGKYTFFDIIQQTGLNSEVVTKKLWEAAWQGRITNDSFAVLRKAILNRFRPFKIEERTPRRSNLSRWSSSRPIHGNWFELVSYGGEMDAFQNEELVRDRIRQLLGRYGVLFRELLEREQSLLRWANIFRSLRIMELSGELITGHFFQGIPGLQFMSHEGFRFLTNSIDENAVYWLNATDPASICGIRLEELKSALPSRVPSTTLVYRGTTLVLVSRRNGKTLEINASLNDNRLYEYLSFFRILLNREFNPMKAVFVETINGEHAAKSEYSKAFKEFGFFVNYNGLELRKSY
ncbi:MAG: ATP-dependent helicase, partial [Thermodesulfobacteriota bacterium]|nr:ATP-dependent helicase [Thermodesulfobacteriota bacterium]